MTTSFQHCAYANECLCTNKYAELSTKYNNQNKNNYIQPNTSVHGAYSAAMSAIKMLPSLMLHHHINKQQQRAHNLNMGV